MADFVSSTLTKSIEVGPYDAKNINRIRWVLQTDDMLTNLSESYIKLNVSIIDASNNPVDVAALTAQNKTIGFGQNGMSYSPASMVRTARLIDIATGKYLEEVAYCNTFTQTVKHQLLNDFESIIGNNLRTGTSIDFTPGNYSLEAAISSFVVNPREVHIPLKDLFSVCKSTAFSMSMCPSGLRVELELEPQQSVFQITELPAANQAQLPESFVDGSGNITIGYVPDASNDFRSFYSPSQFNDSQTQAFIPAPTKIVSSNGWLYTKTLYLHEPNPLFDISGLVLQPGNTIRLKPKWTAPQLAALKFTVGGLIELQLTNTSLLGQVSTFRRIVKIKALHPGTNTQGTTTYGAGIELDTIMYPSTYAETGLITTLESFFLLDPLKNMSVIYQDDSQKLKDLIITNVLSVPDTGMVQLQQLGIVDGSNNLIPDVSFQLIATTTVIDVSDNVLCACESDKIDNVNGVNRLTTNQSVGYPFTTSAVKIISIVDVSDNRYEILFENLELNQENGPWATAIEPATSTYPEGLTVPVNYYNLAFVNVVAATVPQETQNTDYSFKIDRAEIVLLKNPMPKGYKQNPLYTTMKLEIVDIQTEISEFHRQFILEPNCTTCFLLTPQWTKYNEHYPSILSSTRNIKQYRFYIDQIQNTNRPVDVMGTESAYISPLHLEKQFEAFSNSQLRLRNTQGLKAVEETDRPVVLFPIKIYAGQQLMMAKNGAIFTNLIPNNQQKLLQVDLFGTDQNKILPGPIFLFKELIESFLGMSTRN